MSFISVFDVLGPNMIGPSSSHTAGAVNVARLARQMIEPPLIRVEFTLYGSFAETYHGHGTDKALLGGIMGFATDDVRIRDSFAIADTAGLEYSFIPNFTEQDVHPNTVDIVMTNAAGKTLTVRGESIGGGAVRMVRLNGVKIEFTGEYCSLIVMQRDIPGMVAYITNAVSRRNVNIAFMHLFRDGKGGRAYTIVETDDQLPADIIQELRAYPGVDDAILVQA
ncbi:MAG TPA: L-serine ammonia-lyase, iron-sulfur-dependent, subunit beta [Candidatus Avidehalobacter gallistercoris]|uniref:L-serine deaminase n=1 Tax=Candidatus Avidehalobacter gallistercoris TaxID=2840694 RepID=A0A9D1HK96_9FIRM|nr:L-serine ammonia-lyase, iron-sulfur-dependent, subunit beta [Candidatus Avidehalobacter gallistercoris]